MATEKRLISLDEAIAKVKDDGILGEGYSEDERIDDVCDILESCITIDAVEVVHGRWEWKTEDIYRCSNCGEDSHVKEVMGQPDWDYCPNCGAKMRGSED